MNFTKILSIHLDKNVTDDAGHEVRTNFGAYLEENGSVNYDVIPTESVKYAALDAITTWEVHKPILAQAKKVSRSGTLLTHDIQIKAAYALAVVERNGCYLNVEKVEALRIWVQGQLVELVIELQSYGWAPGGGSIRIVSINSDVTRMLTSLVIDSDYELLRTCRSTSRIFFLLSQGSLSRLIFVSI